MQHKRTARWRVTVSKFEVSIIFKKFMRGDTVGGCAGVLPASIAR
jgi:hypothetical protein